MVWSTKIIYKCHDVGDGTCKKQSIIPFVYEVFDAYLH